MNIEQSVEVLRQLVTTSLLVVSPILLASLVVGLAVSLLQAVTSIQEQTLSFVPKLLAISIVLITAAPWMLRQLMQFTITYFSRIPDMVQ
ncbi:MAG: flagellar biosynthesis protein FliQ [Verrucomicrobiota bacterium]|jgi:flagellar biosynthesis protein FliQ